MKIANLIISSLVGLLFVVFGVNHFFNFIPMPPMSGDTGTWIGILVTSKFMTIVKIMEIVFGLMLLVNFKRALAWFLILPIIVCIAMFEVLIAKQPGIGLVLLAINFFMIYMNRESYKGMWG